MSFHQLRLVCCEKFKCIKVALDFNVRYNITYISFNRVIYSMMYQYISNMFCCFLEYSMIRLLIHPSVFLLLSCGSAVSGRGEDERFGFLLLRENVPCERCDLQRRSDLDGRLQKLHMLGGFDGCHDCVMFFCSVVEKPKPCALT